MILAEGMHYSSQAQNNNDYNPQYNSPPGYHSPLQFTQQAPGASRNLSQTPVMFNTPSTENVGSSPSRAATCSPASSTSSVGRSDPPKRLRYWLIDMINGGSIPGLHWVDEAKSIFQIPWKHAGKNNWKEDDCEIFKAWAMHRGKYKPGDKMEAATWKTRLRCALNKLPDIKELRERSSLDGSDPYRVYKLLPEPDKNQEYEIYPRKTWGKESPLYHISEMNGYAMSPSPQQMTSPPHYNIDPSQHMRSNTYDPIPDREFSRMNVQEPSGYIMNKLNIIPPQSVSSETMSSFRTRSQSDDPLYSRHDDVNHDVIPETQGYNNFGYGDNYVDTLEQSLNSLEAAPAHHEMEVYVRYRGRIALETLVKEKSGCRIHHGDTNLQLIASQTHELPSNVFGSDTLQQIALTDSRPFAFSDHQVQLTEHVLKNITRGLILYYNPEDKCFYAKRLCLSRVFVAGPENGDLPEKLERNTPVKVFDYRKFCDQLQVYSQLGKAKTPDIEIVASFGQSWSIKSPIDKNLVTLSMAPRAARYLLMKMRKRCHIIEHGSFNDSILESTKNSVDIIADHAITQSQKCFEDLMHDFNSNVEVEPFSFTSMQGQQHEQPVQQQNGMFQQNNIPLVMPTPMSNDVEMDGVAMN